MFEKHVTRLLSIIFIVLVSVGFISGIGMAIDKIDDSLTDYYITQNVSDFIIKKTDGSFSDEEIEKVRARYGAERVNTGMSVDVEMEIDGETQLVRLYFYDGEQTINLPTVVEASNGAYGEETIAISAERSDNNMKGVALGAQIELDFADIIAQLSEQSGSELDASYASMLAALQPVTVTVTETLQSPLVFAKDGEPSYTNPADVEAPDTIEAVNSLITLENILYLPSSVIPTYGDIVPDALKPFYPQDLDEPLLGTGDIYVAVAERDLFKAFGNKYREFVAEEKEQILSEEMLGTDAEVITLYENYSFLSLHSYGNKVRDICYILMVAFLFVTALVVLSTMTRLLEEERSQVACLKTLGYPSWRIVFKYLLFAMIATGIGGVAAYFVGVGVANLFYVVFNFSFAMPPMSPKITILFFLLSYFIIVVATLFATCMAGFRMTNEKPANLLRPKVPKAGKKVFFEKIPFFWNLLSFKYKSTTRNVLRFKNRFFMTVIAVAFSTALVLTGLGLLDLCLFHGMDSPTITAVSLVVIVFAGLLTAVVIYTLTNINISERNRELATLMVLGYYDGEVAGYIYREVYIDTAVGIIFGYPLAVFLIWLVFNVMAMGSLGGISWFMWLIAPFVVLLFTALVTLLLRHKIVKIDMNESLKAIE